jgi:hypothetical protein
MFGDKFFRNVTCLKKRDWHPVAQLVEALRYKPEGREFDSRWCRRNPEFESASNRNKYQEYFLGVKAVGAQG